MQHPEQTQRAYEAVRARTRQLLAGLSAEDLLLQIAEEASPGKWHLAHTTWFFERFLLRDLLGDQPVHADYDFLFNSYYKGVGRHLDRKRRGQLSRPSLAEILSYRNAIDQRMAQALNNPAPGAEFLRRLRIGLEHEMQHQELILTDIKYNLYLSPMQPPLAPAMDLRHQKAPPLTWLKAGGDVFFFGRDTADFSYDNERPRHRQVVEAFEIASRPLCNQEMLDFMTAGGYERPELWLSDGWDQIAGRQSCPLYWQKRGKDWFVYSSRGFVPLDPDQPAAHLDFYEADALARYYKARLPTEQEWELAMIGYAADDYFDFAGQALDPFFHLSGQVAAGGIWEWTSSAYGPYPGYKIESGALGEYNGKFMNNQRVLRGGSIASPPGHLRFTYRNFFPPGAAWQFSGVRLARDVR
ncbi:MAG: ergothioneine biosynthesis protein EgtB [Spirochaetales bacterium]|nr:ergothioneine biosynthesis protein EgtB [Spirochaetales bacterium]